MKTKLASEILLATLVVLPFLFLAIIWPQLPAQVPGHYGIDGTADRYDPKEELALLMAAVTLFVYLVLQFVPRFDPRRNLNTDAYQKIRLLITLFWTMFLTGFWYISWKGAESDMLNKAVTISVGVLFAGLGNLMNSIKSNYFVGIRTPWTLDSETVWRRTHHFGARLFVGGGLLVIASAWLVPASFAPMVLVGVPLLVAVITVWYSYRCFQQEKARQLG